MSNIEEKEINKISKVFIGQFENEIDKKKKQVVISVGMKKKDKKELIKSIQENNGKINEIEIKLSKNENKISSEKNSEIGIKITEMELLLKEIYSRSKKQNKRIRIQENLIKELNNKIEKQFQEISQLKNNTERILLSVQQNNSHILEFNNKNDINSIKQLFEETKICNDINEERFSLNSI
ncbi:hypothetical protein ACTA71_002769 [Dictyostelium dimigraforme]